MNDLLERLDHDRKWDARHSNGTIRVDARYGETRHQVWTAQMTSLNSIEAVAHSLEPIRVN